MMDASACDALKADIRANGLRECPMSRVPHASPDASSRRRGQRSENTHHPAGDRHHSGPTPTPPHRRGQYAVWRKHQRLVRVISCELQGGRWTVEVGLRGGGCITLPAEGLVAVRDWLFSTNKKDRGRICATISTAAKKENPMAIIDKAIELANGQEQSILIAVAGASSEWFDGRGRPCPKCGGTNRFSWRAENQSLYCRQCYHVKKPDIVGNVAWLLDKPQREAAELILRHLGRWDEKTHRTGQPKKSKKHKPIPRSAANVLGPPIDSGVKWTEPGNTLESVQAWNLQVNQLLRSHDPITIIASQKGIPSPQALLRYGGSAGEKSVNGRYPQHVDFPAYDATGKECTSFRMFCHRSDEDDWHKKGKYEIGKDAGVFFPHDANGEVILPQPGELWLIPEGVKDAATLYAMGYDQTIGRPGASLKTAKQNFAKLFRGCDVILIPDHDVAGHEGAAKSIGALWEAGAKSAKVAPLLTTPPAESDGMDVRDVLRQHGEQAIHDAISNATESGLQVGAKDKVATCITPSSAEVPFDIDRLQPYLPLPSSKSLVRSIDTAELLGEFVSRPATYRLGSDEHGNYIGEVAKSHESHIYRQGERPVRVGQDESDGSLKLEPIKAAKLCSKAEEVASLCHEAIVEGKTKRRPATMPKSLADIVIESDAFQRSLNPLETITAAPVAKYARGDLQVVTGYDRELRTYAAGDEPEQMELDQAVELLTAILSEYKFRTKGDYARAIAAIMTPALMFGKHVKSGRYPAFVISAD